jgi:hypothetical protein
MPDDASGQRINAMDAPSAKRTTFKRLEDFHKRGAIDEN